MSDGSARPQSESNAAQQLLVENADDPGYRGENRISRNRGKKSIEIDAAFLSNAGHGRERDGQLDKQKKDGMKIGQFELTTARSATMERWHDGRLLNPRHDCRLFQKDLRKEAARS